MNEIPVDTGFAVAIAGFLVYWVTKSLNGKLDRISDGLHRLADMLEHSTCPLNNKHGEDVVYLRETRDVRS